MIAYDDPEAVLGRFWQELTTEPEMAPLAAILAWCPTDRPLTVIDLIPLVPAAMPLLGTSADQVLMLDAAVRAYARARGLHFAED